MTVRHFKLDAALIAAQRFRSGQIDRRTFAKALAGLGVLAVAKPGISFGQATEIVICNWGGAAEAAFQEAYGKPFTEATGIPVVIDGSGPAIGAIRAMVESGAVTWDVTDSGTGDSMTLGAGGYVEPINYDVVDRNLVLPGMALEFGVCNYVFANILAYDTSRTGAEAPSSWADFFDFDKYPGKRTMCKWITAQLEGVLLADGVAPADLYPLDVDRAFAKLEPILPEIIFWEGGAQSQQLFRDGEVVMGNIWHTRANLLRQEDAKFDFTWNQNLMMPSTWCVPKGNPAGATVWDFIQSSLQPEGQLTLLRLMGNGPTNPVAIALMTEEERKVSPTAPENQVTQVAIDPTWYLENEADVQARFLDFISG